MTQESFIRTEALLGTEAVEQLGRSKIAVFGIGGVGGFAAEALARSGIGEIDLFDHDCVSVSNINRQIIAMESTVGRPKVEVMRERILDINPKAVVHAYQTFYLPENAGEYDLGQYDYVVDAVDTVTAKLELAVQAQKAGVPIISSMGTGNKREATLLEVADLYQTSVCPLAKVMRRECRKRGIGQLKVVYSKEEPIVLQTEILQEENSRRRAIPGSVSFVPSAAGLILAGEVVKDLIDKSRLSRERSRETNESDGSLSKCGGLL